MTGSVDAGIGSADPCILISFAERPRPTQLVCPGLEVENQKGGALIFESKRMWVRYKNLGLLMLCVSSFTLRYTHGRTYLNW